MIALLNFLRRAFTFIIKFLVSFKNFLKFKSLVIITLKVSILVIFLSIIIFVLERLFYFLEVLADALKDISMSIPDALLEHLEFLNYLFPLEEFFYLFSVWSMLWSLVLVIRVIKSMSPTIDGNKI